MDVASLELFQRERQRLIRLVERIVGCAATAEDIAQDTFLRLRGRTLGPGDANLLLRTGQNLAIDHIRSLRVRQQHATLTVAAASDGDLSDDTPERHDASARRLDGLQRVLRALPVRTQRVFLMQRLDGMTYPKIAAALQVSTSTVEKEMIRAIEACRHHLAEQQRQDEGIAPLARSPRRRV